MKKIKESKLRDKIELTSIQNAVGTGQAEIQKYPCLSSQTADNWDIGTQREMNLSQESCPGEKTFGQPEWKAN